MAHFFTDRVINWNKLRYEQEFDYELAVKLLTEEIDELFEAKLDITKMDAVGDIVFVAVGVFWKFGLHSDFITSIFYSASLGKLDKHQAVAYLNDINIELIDNVSPNAEGAWPALQLALHAIFIVGLSALRGIKMQESFYHIMQAICDSNDTKEIKGITPSNVKANIVKGEGYVSPTKDLANIHALYSKRG